MNTTIQENTKTEADYVEEVAILFIDSLVEELLHQRRLGTASKLEVRIRANIFQYHNGLVTKRVADKLNEAHKTIWEAK